jgi:hypothetical protein
MAVILRKLFGVGKLPADLHAQVDDEGLIHLAEYVAVTRRFSGSIPGLRVQGSIASYVGCLAFTSQRVLATLSVVPKLAGRAVERGAGRRRVRGNFLDGITTRHRHRRR